MINFRVTLLICSVTHCFNVSANTENRIPVTIDITKCQELVETAESTAQSVRRAGLAAAEQIDGGQDVEEGACLNDIRSVDFDFFSGIPSIQGAAIKELKDSAIAQITNMSCDAANIAINAYNTTLTCNASAGVQLGVGAGFDDLDVEECAGAGSDALQYEYDGGNYNLGGSQYNIDLDNGSSGSVLGNGDSSQSSGLEWGDWLDAEL